MSQAAPGDELIVERDATGDWGATPRTRGQRAASGDYILWMDDDDVYTPGALTAIRQALLQAPGRPHIFRLRRGAPFHDLLPRVREVKVGEVSTQVFVCPNDPARMGEWGTRYEGDFDFIASTLAKWPPNSVVFRDEIIAVWRPGVVPFAAAVTDCPATVTLDAAVARLAQDSPDGRVAVLKIDCEGGSGRPSRQPRICRWSIGSSASGTGLNGGGGSGGRRIWRTCWGRMGLTWR